MGVEMTSGFDSQLINTLQFSKPFNTCRVKSYQCLRQHVSDHNLADFGEGYVDDKGAAAIKPSIIGFMSACYQLGSVLAVPIAPWMNRTFGRRWSVMTGSLTMVVGALLQGFGK